MRKLTCDPGAEILGTGVRAFVDNLQSDQTRPIMEKHHIQEIGPNDWVPTSRLLDALNEVAAHPNMTLNLVAIGVQVGTIFPMPPELVNPDISDVLRTWNGIYQAINRGGDAGIIGCERVTDRHYKTIHTDLFPDDFTYGIVYGYARRFLPPGSNFTVYYDMDSLPRDQGGSGPTIIHLEWD